MKCDPDPIACQPCRQKSLKCFTTDRVSGQSRERGQFDRAEGEVSYLRDQLAQYQRRYGSLSAELPPTPYSAFPSPANDRNPSLMSSHSEIDPKPAAPLDIPSSTYVGWPTLDAHSPLQEGPVEGSRANLLEWGFVDSAAFECDIMKEPDSGANGFFNFSSGSMLMTMNQLQRIHDPLLPTKADAITLAEMFLTVMWGFMPILHKASFISLVHQQYDSPQTVTTPEKAQVVLMLAIISYQTATRNHTQAAKIHDSYRFFHYVLAHYHFLMQDNSLASMQALAMMLVQLRSLPKPGLTWKLAQQILVKAIDQDYHRDPNRILLPSGEATVLAKELRKRVFHSILGICIATGCRLGRPAPWQFVQWDVPLPMAVKDSEISADGISVERSGQCDFLQSLHLTKLLPLYTELSRYILSVRRSPPEYLKILEVLRTKVDAWRTEWDKCIVNTDSSSPQIIIATLFLDSLAAEFLLKLHHPSVCTSRAPEVMERNLDVCHKAARRLLTNFHTLAKKYKAADFTWQSTVAYTLGFGMTLHIYRRRAGHLSQEQFDAMPNELAGWMSLMAYTDLVLRTNNHLQKCFDPLAKEVQAICRDRFTGRTSLDGQASGPLPNNNNATLGIKTELGTQPMSKTRTSQDFGIAPGSSAIQQGPRPGTHSQSAAHCTQFPNAPGNPPTGSYGFSPNAASFPPLPVSLAPLLNEVSSSDRLQNRAISSALQQEVSMMFQPQLYTGDEATYMWPIRG